MRTEGTPPDGYRAPLIAYLVEYVDPREPGEGSFQLGAFTDEADAETLRARMAAEGFFADLRINVVPVHNRLVDWEWDR